MLNEPCTITFYPVWNENNHTANIIDLPPEAFVLEELTLHSWSNDVLIGLALPPKCTITLEFGILENAISLAANKYLFDSILNTSKEVEFYVGTEFEYKTYLSNYIRVESASLGVMHFMQTVYSSVDLSLGRTSITLEVTELASYLLKITSINSLLYVLSNITTLGAKGEAWEEVPFAFDWLNTYGYDPLWIVENDPIYPLNKFYSERFPIGYMISGQFVYNGVSNSTEVRENYHKWEMNKIMDGYATPQANGFHYNAFRNEQTFYCAQNVPAAFHHFRGTHKAPPPGHLESVNLATFNGFTRLRFVNIKSLFNFTYREILAMISLYDASINSVSIDMAFDYFYKQRYDGSNYRGDLIEDGNHWMLTKVIGCGSFEHLVVRNEGSIPNDEGFIWNDDEVYFTDQDIRPQLDYACLYDLLSDFLLSTLQSYIMFDSSIIKFTSDIVKDVYFEQAAIEKKIEFNYKVISIQTGDMNLDATGQTTVINPTSASTLNINIPRCFHVDAIDPTRAIRHSFCTGEGEYSYSAEALGRECFTYYLSDNPSLSGQYVSEDIDEGLPTPFKGWGNAGFKNRAHYKWSIADEYNTTPMFQELAWYVTGCNNSSVWDYYGWIPEAPDGSNSVTPHVINGVSLISGAIKPVEMIHLNTYKFSVLKMWYRAKYRDTENPDPKENDSSLQALHSDEPIFISAHHNNCTYENIDASLKDLRWLTLVDFRWNVVDNYPPANYRWQYLGESQKNVINRSLSTTEWGLIKLRDRYKEYRELSKTIFNNFSIDYLYKTSMLNSSPIILKVLLTEFEYSEIFNNLPVQDLYRYKFNIHVTSNAIYSVLNTIYNVVNIRLSKEGYEIAFTSIYKGEQ
jgi:hypothetical protein